MLEFFAVLNHRIVLDPAATAVPASPALSLPRPMHHAMKTPLLRVSSASTNLRAAPQQPPTVAPHPTGGKPCSVVAPGQR